MTEEPKTKTYADFVLPPSVITRVDIAHIVSELEWIDGEMTAAAVRAKVGTTQQAAPGVSGPLDDFLSQNKLTLDNSQQRTELIKLLRQLKDKVPVIHMTFAVTADRESLQKIAAWLRSSVHSQAVISVGLQPALVAGVYLRTPNHVHDLSMRAALKKSRGLLAKELEALRG